MITHFRTFARSVFARENIDVSSLTEIQCLQIEPSEKGAHTNESMMLKIKV